MVAMSHFCRQNVSQISLQIVANCLHPSEILAYFYGKWKVALTEFHATEIVKSSNIGRIYVYTDLCKESIVFGEERLLLRRLEKNRKAKWDFMFDTPFYIPVKKQELREFEIYIMRDRDRTPQS